MKTKQKFSSYWLIIMLLLVVPVLFVSCDDDDDDIDDIVLSLSGNASGAQEVPAVTTTASGTLSGTYNDNTNELKWAISWNGLSGDVVAAHFHGPAAAGTNAPPVIPISITTSYGSSGSLTGTETLNATIEGYLKAGTLYYNLHTATYPDGEIRGQVTAN